MGELLPTDLRVAAVEGAGLMATGETAAGAGDKATGVEGAAGRAAMGDATAVCLSALPPRLRLPLRAAAAASAAAAVEGEGVAVAVTAIAGASIGSRTTSTTSPSRSSE
jgi:hypothetical protein